MDDAWLKSLEDVIRRPELVLVEIVTQDEYTHDVVFSTATRFVVFDAT